jgi:hypothetical protein
MRAIMTNEDVGNIIDFRTFGPVEAQHPWPAETVVSAGRGVVFITNAKEGEPQSYRTLFMEVYPPGAGFIRGEGATPEECENAAWAKYELAIFCTDGRGVHCFVPRAYKNGAGFCSFCSTFKSDAFTGEQLGQLCRVCGTGTTHHWEETAEGEFEFLCKDHYVASARTAQKPGSLGALLSALFGDEDDDEPNNSSIPDEKSIANE